MTISYQQRYESVFSFAGFNSRITFHICQDSNVKLHLTRLSAGHSEKCQHLANLRADRLQESSASHLFSRSLTFIFFKQFFTKRSFYFSVIFTYSLFPLKSSAAVVQYTQTGQPTAKHELINLILNVSIDKLESLIL